MQHFNSIHISLRLPMFRVTQPFIKINRLRLNKFENGQLNFLKFYTFHILQPPNKSKFKSTKYTYYSSVILKYTDQI